LLIEPIVLFESPMRSSIIAYRTLLSIDRA
jgi:hypothetical protein